MKRMMIALTLCLAAGWASASVDLRVFQSTAGANWPRLEAQLSESGKITSEGLIDAGTLAGIAVQVAIERGVLKDPTEEERQAYGMAFLSHNGIGATIHKDQFRAIGADKDPKKGFRLPDPRAAVQATAQPVVPAASAPATSSAFTDAVKALEKKADMAVAAAKAAAQTANNMAAAQEKTSTSVSAALSQAGKTNEQINKALTARAVKDKEIEALAANLPAATKSLAAAEVKTTAQQLRTEMSEQGEVLKQGITNTRTLGYYGVLGVLVLVLIAFVVYNRLEKKRARQVVTEVVKAVAGNRLSQVELAAQEAKTAAAGASAAITTFRGELDGFKQTMREELDDVHGRVTRQYVQITTDRVTIDARMSEIEAEVAEVAADAQLAQEAAGVWQMSQGTRETLFGALAWNLDDMRLVSIDTPKGKKLIEITRRHDKFVSVVGISDIKPEDLINIKYLPRRITAAVHRSTCDGINLPALVQQVA